MPKVYIVEGNSQYRNMFLNHGWKFSDTIEGADLIQFTGGEDVSPGLYCEEVHPQTGNNPHRDLYEAKLFKKALALGKPMAGICRGAQFLNVMSGGSMWQHVDNHAVYGTHEAFDLETGDEVNVTSTHHQMMRPSDECIFVCVAYEAKRIERMEGYSIVGPTSEERNYADTEVVYYPETKSLCFQPHPEFPGYDECTEYYFKLIERYLEL